MRTWLTGIVSVLACVSVCQAAPMRLALMDFTDASGGSADTFLGGDVDSEQLASKGAFAMSRALLGKGDYVLIDRRDFINQLQKMQGSLEARDSDIRPSFIQAAQALRADAVLRGTLLSFSVGKQMISQGGQNVEFANVSVRVGIDAVDAVDGSVIAAVEGVAQERFRQTDMMRTVLGGDEVHQMLTAAISRATPELISMLNARMASGDLRETVFLSVDTTADPSMVEIDGILVGTTPVQDLSVYKGDHVLTISRPGYQPVTKRLVLEGNTKISAPMLRTDLTVEERVKVLEGADMRYYITEGGKPDMVIQVLE